MTSITGHSRSMVLTDLEYATDRLEDKIDNSNTDITIFTTSLDDKIEDSIDSSEMKKLSLLCKTYKDMFNQELEKIKNNKTDILSTQLYLSPVNTYIGSMQINKQSRISDVNSRSEYTKNKDAIKQKYNYNASIGWKKINVNEICYGGPRDILEQYFNLYMAYRIIDYEDTFNELISIIKKIKEKGEFDGVTIKDSNSVEELYKILHIGLKSGSDIKDDNIKKIYDDLKSVYFVPLSKFWTDETIGLLMKKKTVTDEALIKKHILINFGIPITDKKISELININRDHGTLLMNVDNESPFGLETMLDCGKGKDNTKVLHDFEITRRGYMNWLMKIKMHDTPGYRQCMTNVFNTKEQVNYSDSKYKSKFLCQPNKNFFTVSQEEKLDKTTHFALIPDRLFTKNLNMYNNRIIDMVGGGIRSGWMFSDFVTGFDSELTTLKNSGEAGSVELSQYGNASHNSIVVNDDVIPFNCTIDEKNLFSENNPGEDKKNNKNHLKNIMKTIDNIRERGMFDSNVSDLLDYIQHENKTYKEKNFRFKEKQIKPNIDFLRVNLFSNKNILTRNNVNSTKYPICNNGLMGRLFFPSIKIKERGGGKDINKDIYDIFEPKKVAKDELKRSDYSGLVYKNEYKKYYDKSFYSYGQITGCNTNIGYSFNISQLTDEDSKLKLFGTYQDFFNIENENRNYNIYGGRIKIYKNTQVFIQTDINESLSGKIRLEDVNVTYAHGQFTGSASYLGSNHILFNSLYDDTTYTARRRLGNSSGINNLVSFQFKNSPVYDFTMSYCHYSEKKESAEELVYPYIFDKEGKKYVIPFENINNLDGEKYRVTNIFTVCTTSNCGSIGNLDYNYYKDLTAGLEDMDINNNKSTFVDRLMYIGNDNFRSFINNYSLNEYNLNNLNDFTITNSSGSTIDAYFPMSAFYDSNISSNNPIEKSTRFNYSTFILDEMGPLNSLYTNTTYYYIPRTGKYYANLLRDVFSGISYQSQLAFFNNGETVYRGPNQGYSVSLYGTNGKKLNCYMTHYYIQDNKLKYDKKDNTTQFDFSIGTKMLSLVLGCLICSADRPRKQNNFYALNDILAIYRPGNVPPVKVRNPESLIEISSNWKQTYNQNLKINSKMYSPTIIPFSYRVGDGALDTLTYYQNSNIFNFKSYKQSESNTTITLFKNPNLISMYDNGKSLLPIGGYCKYPEKDIRNLGNNINEILLENGLNDVLENTILPEDIWKQQNGEICETQGDAIHVGIYKHSLLNNIITDNYNVLAKTSNSYIKNMAELIIYISTLGVMLSWLTLYHYTTKGDYKESVGTGEVNKNYKTCYNDNLSLHPFSIDLDYNERILPFGLDSEKIKKLNISNNANWDSIKNKEILTSDGKDKEDWGYKLNYEYGGLLTFIHNKNLDDKIKGYLDIDTNEKYVTHNSNYTWNVPALLYYNDRYNKGFYDKIIETDEKLEVDIGKGQVLQINDINTENAYNISDDKLNSKLFYVNALLFIKNTQDTEDKNPVKNIEFSDTDIDVDKILKNDGDVPKSHTLSRTANSYDVKKADIQKYRSYLNYGGVNNIQYLVSSDVDMKDIKEKYNEMYANIGERYAKLKKHTEKRAQSMVDFWRDLQMIPAYVDGQDFNIKTEVMSDTGAINREYSGSLRNIGGDNGLITVGGGKMGLKYDKYENLVSTSEEIVQKILVKMGISTSIRNNFNKKFNNKYLEVDKKKLEVYKPDDSDLSKVINEIEKKYDKFSKPLLFYNNINNDTSKEDIGLFHTDAVQVDKDGRVKNIIGGTLMTHKNIDSVVSEFIEIFKSIWGGNDDNIKTLKKDYTRALYKVHQMLFEVPLMNYKIEDTLTDQRHLESIKSLIRSIDTNKLTPYQSQVSSEDKKILDEKYGYEKGRLIPDIDIPPDSNYLDNKYTKEGKTKLSGRSSKNSDYMSLFNNKGDDNKLVQKITVVHQTEFIDAFTAMINLAVLDYYSSSKDDEKYETKIKILENICEKKSSDFIKIGLKDNFEYDGISFNSKGKSYPKININEFFRIYYILQDRAGRESGDIFSLDDYLKHQLNIKMNNITGGVVSVNNIIEEFVISNLGLFKDNISKNANINIEDLKRIVSNSREKYNILEQLESIELACGIKLSRDDKLNEEIEKIRLYYTKMSLDMRAFFSTTDFKKILLKDVIYKLREKRIRKVEEKVEKFQTELINQVKDEFNRRGFNDISQSQSMLIEDVLKSRIEGLIYNLKTSVKTPIKTGGSIINKSGGSNVNSVENIADELKVFLLKLVYDTLHNEGELPDIKRELQKYNNDMLELREAQKKIIVDIKRFLNLRGEQKNKNLYYKEIQVNIFKQDEILKRMSKIIKRYKNRIERLLENIIIKLLVIQSHNFKSYILALKDMYPSLSTIDEEFNSIVGSYKNDLLSILEINDKIFDDIIKYIKIGKNIDNARFESYYGTDDVTKDRGENSYSKVLNNSLYCIPQKTELCKESPTHSGVWVIVETTTFPSKDKKKLAKETVHSLYDILTGKVIYCMGGLRRDNLYYKYNINAGDKDLYKRLKSLAQLTSEKIFGEGDSEKKIIYTTLMYKIPKVCSFDEISGPILSLLNINIVGDNLYYFKPNLNKDCKFYKNGLLYFTPFSKRYVEKMEKSFNYNLDLDIEKDEETYLWYWNVLELYKYIGETSVIYLKEKIMNDFRKKYLEVDDILAASITNQKMKTNLNKNLIDLYIQPSISIKERDKVNHNSLFVYNAFGTTVSFTSSTTNSLADLKRFVSEQKITDSKDNVKQIPGFTGCVKKEEIYKKFIELDNDDIQNYITKICNINDKCFIKNYNDKLSMLNEEINFNIKFEDGIDGNRNSQKLRYPTIESYVLINRIKKIEHRILFHQVFVRDVGDIVTNILPLFKKKEFRKNIGEDSWETFTNIFEEIRKNKSKINANKDPTMYMKLVIYTITNFIRGDIKDNFIKCKEKEILDLYKKILFEILFNQRTSNYYIRLIKEEDKYIANVLDEPLTMNDNLMECVRKYIGNVGNIDIGNVGNIDIKSETDIMKKLVYDPNNNDNNYYGKYLVILSNLFICYYSGIKSGGGNGSSILKTMAAKSIYEPIRWSLNSIELDNIFKTVKNEIILNRKAIVENMDIEQINYSPFTKCKIPRLFNNYDYASRGSKNTKVYVLGYETSSTKLTLDNLIVERYSEKYKVWNDIGLILKNITKKVSMLIDEKVKTNRLQIRNKEELRYITAKYRRFFELNYFKFLGRDLLKQLIELTESAKLTFKKYLLSDHEIGSTESISLLKECLSEHKNMIYGNDKKLNSYGSLNSMYLGVLLSIWGGNILFTESIKKIDFTYGSEYSDEYELWCGIVKTTWFSNTMVGYLNSLNLDKEKILYREKMWYYPGYNNYYLYYDTDDLAARFISGDKLVFETSKYINEYKKETSFLHVGKIKFESNRVRLSESNISKITGNQFKKLMSTKKGGVRKSRKNNWYKDYINYIEYINNYNFRNNERGFNIYMKIKNKDIQSLYKLEKIILKYKKKIEKINKKNKKNKNDNKKDVKYI